jgi:SAM-dependent methyltransferase
MMKYINRLLSRAFGLRLVREYQVPPINSYEYKNDYDVGEYTISLAPLAEHEKLGYGSNPKRFIVKCAGEKVADELVLYSQATLIELLYTYDFDSVLDIGAHKGHVSRIFQGLQKKVFSIDTGMEYPVDYCGDYLSYSFDRKFDAIWCSQVLEHQRDIGLFLRKIYSDLEDNGICAITVPWDGHANLTFGHINKFTPLNLIYHLVCSGFDCSNAALCVFDKNIGIIARKNNKVDYQVTSYASLPSFMNEAEISEQISDIDSRFPFPVKENQVLMNQKYLKINWLS